jgi:hypothetical protein
MDSQMIPDKRSADDAKQRDDDHQRPQAELKLAALFVFGGSALGGSVCMAALSPTAGNGGKIRGRLKLTRSRARIEQC